MDISQNNRNMIQFQINQKTQYNVPFYATQDIVESTMSPFDHFPYKYFWRGEAQNPNPVIMEREAGYRPLHNRCYKQLGIPKKGNHSRCWSYPCNTVSPCCPGNEIDRKQIGFGQELCESNCNTRDRDVTFAP
ncbi:hypothetical protein OAV62_01230 [bacterium]|nr:hypothetical protein [bacterium]